MDIRFIWEKILNFFGLENNLPEEEQIHEKSENNRVVSIYKQQGFRIIVHSPQSFAEVQNIVDQIKGRKPIILNLEQIEKDQARRIIDFISGAAYGLDGHVEKLSDVIFIFTPSNVKLDGEILQKNKSLFK